MYCGNLKWHTFIRSQFCRWEIQAGATGFYPLSLTRPISRCHQNGFLCGGSGKIFDSKLIKDTGRIQFFVGVRLGIPFLAGHQPGCRAGCVGWSRGTQLPKACLYSLACVPSIFKSTREHQISPTFHFPTSWKNISASERDSK